MLDFFKKSKIVIKTKTEYIYVDQQKRFKGMVVLITGASGSIGRAISKRFALEGATVVLSGRSEDKLQKLADELGKAGSVCDIALMDVTHEQADADAKSEAKRS